MKSRRRSTVSLAVFVLASHAAHASAAANAEARKETNNEPNKEGDATPPDPPRPFEVSFYVRGWFGPASGQSRSVPDRVGWTFGGRVEALMPKESTWGLSNEKDPRFSFGPYAEIGTNGRGDLLVGGGGVVHWPAKSDVPIAPSLGVYASNLHPWNTGVTASVYIDVGGYDIFGVRLGTRIGLGEERERVYFAVFDFHGLVPLSPLALPYLFWKAATGFGRMPAGRPVRIDGAPVLPRVDVDAADHQGAVDVSALTPRERAWLARAWLEEAMLEHASIAAFAALSLDLLRVGAPAELVSACHEAALDEVAHAREAFALASAYAGRTLTAGEMPELARAPRSDLRTMLRDAISDGAIGEGIAAATAAHAYGQAHDPAVRAQLARVAADEANHAQLGWAVARFCAARLSFEDAHSAIEEACLARPAMREVPRRGLDPRRLAAHGRPPSRPVRALERLVRASAWRDARALLRPAGNVPSATGRGRPRNSRGGRVDLGA